LTWKIEFTEEATKDFKRLDRSVQRLIHRYLRERIATDNSPRRLGKPLRGEKQGLWRYRIGDYRVICYIEDEMFVVLGGCRTIRAEAKIRKFETRFWLV
jgi:mRNA interferase RelE/StbE